MKKYLKWAGNILSVFLILILCVSIFSMINAKKNGDQLPSVFGYIPMSVLSGSMRPMLEPGDMIIVNKIEDAGEIQVGDVVTYRVDRDTLVTHRVIEVVNEQNQLKFRTQGDANNIEDDSLISSKQVVGTFSARLPYGGYAANFARSPKGFIFLILVPTVLLIGGEIKNILSLEGEKSKKNDSPKVG